MKVYEIKMQKGGKGVFKVSLVKDPAIEENLLHFSKEKPQLFADEEKRIIYAPAMIPNKMIYRKDINGEEANVFYTSETITEMMINYARNNGSANTNINHSEMGNINGVFPFECWQVADKDNDKSNVLGFNSEVGTWIQAYKVDNDEVWKHVKNKGLDGLSVEMVNIEYKEHEQNKTEKMEKSKEKKEPTFMESLKALFSKHEIMAEDKEEEKEEEVKVEEQAEEVKEEVKVEEQAEHEEGEEEPTEREKALMDEVISLKQTIAELEADKVKEGEELETMKSDIEKYKTQIAGAKPIPLLPKPEKFKEVSPELEKFKKQHLN
jgi:hypothetical protein